MKFVPITDDEVDDLLIEFGLFLEKACAQERRIVERARAAGLNPENAARDAWRAFARTVAGVIVGLGPSSFKAATHAADVAEADAASRFLTKWKAARGPQ